MTKHTVVLERVAQRRPDPSKIQRQIAEILERALASTRGKQFRLSSEVPDVIEPVQEGDSWHYKLDLVFEHTGRGDPDQQFNAVKDTLLKTAPSKGGWNLAGDHKLVGPNLAVFDETDMIAEVTVERGNHFDHLYGLDSQIEIVLASLQTAKDTNYKKRFHSVLYGKPGCGKSDLLRGIKNMVGAEGCLEFDGTQTTAAGAIAAIMEATFVPPLLVIEEIEKVPDSSFMWLLGALDVRGEIRKTTARGNSHRKVPFVCVATVNDLALFKSRHEGAMASRFSHQIYCPRPSDETLRRILEREVESVQGNPEWIEPTIRFCKDVERTTDPRRFIAVCLTGRDNLLTGKFQHDLIACQHKEE